MKFGGPLLAVKDMAASKEFYETILGNHVVFDLGVHASFAEGFSLQQGYAELVGIDPASVVKQSHNFQLYFEVEDLKMWDNKLKDNGTIEYVHGIKEYEWGQRVFRVYDPDRNIVEIAEGMEIVAKRFLSQGLSVEETAKRMMSPVEFVKSFL